MILELLFRGLVQGAVIVAVTYIASRCISDRSAATRYALWFAALLAMVTIPVLTTVSDIGARLVDALRAPSAGHSTIVSLLPAGTLTNDVMQYAVPMTAWIFSAWVAGATFQCWGLLVSFIRIQRIRKNATPVPALGSNVFTSQSLAVPMAVGIRLPAVILPEYIVKTYAPADVERIVAHEIGHLRRMDVAGNFVQRLIEAILFFNPWVFVIGHELNKEREAAADDWAIVRTGAAGDYAECLALLAQRVGRVRAQRLAPGALSSGNSVVARIERIVRHGASAALELNYYAIGGLVMLFALLTIGFQALTPVAAAPASATSPPVSMGVKGLVISAACTVPRGSASTISPATPNIPNDVKLSGNVDVLVNVAPNGRLIKATIIRSSGNARADAAVLAAATASSYAPAHKDCRPVSGTVVFRASISPTF